MKNLILLLGLILLNTSFALAQPYLKGCRFASHAHDLKPLTEQEKHLNKLSAERSDTIDILNYDIQLEITDFTSKVIKGFTEITFTPKMADVEHIELNLLNFTVDSVWFDGSSIPFVNDGLFVSLDFPQAMQPSETAKLRIFYRGTPTVAASGFGGLAFANGIAYNLGIGLGSNLYNYGRGWYPCFDNFVERATYDFTIISELPRKGHCTGNFVEEVDLGNNKLARSFRMDKQLPSYLAGVAVGEFAEVTDVHIGANNDVPTQLLAAPSNITAMENSFVDLGGVIDALEYWFGPYGFDKVGFVTTSVGAMEHASLIAYPTGVATEGNTFRNRRLMAHELAHHWWGNVAGIPSAADMWFKEGNAEYSAHLITEYLFGREAFLDQVIDNHMDVMRNAHIEDQGYWPLSGIPYEHTYGTHTYYKGACMMHNLRGYMGDEKYRSAMTAVQANLGFQSITADDFRDYLSNHSGIDLTSFFQDWLKSPGWAGYALDGYEITENGGNFTVAGRLFQGLRGAQAFHTNAPIHLTFYSENDDRINEIVYASDEYTDFSIELPWSPKIVLVNEDHTLNLAQVQVIAEVDEAGNTGLNATDFIITVNEPAGENKFIIDHYWFGAPSESMSADYRLSSNHFWRVEGDFAADYDFTAMLEYRGNSSSSFDVDLVSETEDSLILAWRPNGSEPWMEYPFYTKNIVVNNSDGFGFINLSYVLKGDYAFANGDLPLASVKEHGLKPGLVFPNPFKDEINATWQDFTTGKFDVQLINAKGQVVRKQSIQHAGGELKVTLQSLAIPNGTYWLILKDEQQRIQALERLIAVH